MHPDHLNHNGATDCSLLFDDIQALDQLAIPEHDCPTQHPEVPGDCQLLDDIRAADRILRAFEPRLETANSAGHRSERSYADLRISRNRCLNMKTGRQMENTNHVPGQPANFGLRQSIFYSARAPPLRWTAPELMTRSSTSLDGHSKFNRRGTPSSGDIAFVAEQLCHYIFLESP